MDEAFDREGRTVRRCKRCGDHVSTQFAKVFGDNDDTVHRCIGCSSVNELHEAANVDS